MSARLRLLAALAAPFFLVGWAMGPLGDLRVAFLVYVLGGCLIVPALLVGARPASGLPFRAPAGSWRAPLIAVLLFGPVFLLLYSWLRNLISAPEPWLEQLESLHWDDRFRVPYLLAFLACVPLAEEWWWRGQALPRAEKLFGRWPGVILVSLGFTSYHAPVLWQLYPPDKALLRLTGVLIGGVVFTLIAERTRSWGISWWAHFSADLVIVIAFLLWIVPQA